MLIGHPTVISSNPCVPTPCGSFSICQEHNGTASCSCLPNYIGRPPMCRPECMGSGECAPTLACINQRCKDPCIGVCGSYATCIVSNHQANCRCPDGYIGDPFSACTPAPSMNRFLHLNYKIIQFCLWLF